MIDEQDLFALGEATPEPMVACRPVGEVLARGTRLRRRRHAVRTVGASTVLAGLVGSGIAVLGRGSGQADLQAGQEPTTTASTSDVPSSPPPAPAPGCESTEFVAPRHMLPGEVPDAMRVLPSWTPGGVEVTHARGERYTFPCPDEPAFPADDALELRADGGDGTIAATINVSGPLPRPLADDENYMIPGEQPTEARGRPAIYANTGTDGAPVLFAWTEADGWSWELRGYGAVDEATLRALGEALVLDSSPEGDEPVADLAPEAVPVGFSIAWQTRGLPAPVGDQTTSWSVTFGGSPDAAETGVQSGIQCMLQVDEALGQAPFEAFGAAGSQPTTVNGQLAWWSFNTGGAAGLGSALRWEVAPGLVAAAGCTDWDDGGTLPLETIVQLAESVVPVPADDSRVPQEIPPQPTDDLFGD